MKIRIHFTRNKVEDYFDVVGYSIEEVCKKIDSIQDQRGLNPDFNEMWSEEIQP